MDAEVTVTIFRTRVVKISLLKKINVEDAYFAFANEKSKSSILSRSLMAISLNESSALGYIDKRYKRLARIFNGANLSEFKDEDIPEELYDRDIGVFLSDEEYDVYCAVMSYRGKYVGHVYFWSTEYNEDGFIVYNIMGIRSSLEYIHRKRQEKLPSITNYLFSAIQRFLLNNMEGEVYMRVVAPLPNMAKICTKLGMHTIEDLSLDLSEGYVGEGPVTCEDEACCGNYTDPIINVKEDLNFTDLEYTLLTYR